MKSRNKSAAASTADQGSSEFLINAIAGNTAEIQMGKLARQKSTNSEIQNFGNTLEKDHGEANETASKLAHSSNIQASEEPNQEQKQTYSHLAELSGTQFDEEFIKVMIKDHKKDINKYESQAHHGDDSISQYARQTLPVLQRHLKMVEQLKSRPSAR